ncbi:MAG: hypothetical protein M3321_00530, partial [Actinomycetota bacterium]|nr:hypothetical protein [Actinomycetota bacterium]
MSRKRVRLAIAAGAGVILAIALVLVAGAMRAPDVAAKPAVDAEAPPALAKRLAQLQTYSPGTASLFTDSPDGFAQQDLYERSVDGQGDGPPTFFHFATARNDYHGLLGRPAVGTGAWVPYGPTNGLNDLTNARRDRAVYNAGTENFGGRTLDGEIDPGCAPPPGECALWIANSSGGVWRTLNALDTDNPATQANEGPIWEYLSHTFEHNNVGAIELDPNDPSRNTLWAGTGEFNACAVCEIGVGVYVTKSAKSKAEGSFGWQGPLGEKHFFGRGIGDIQVKPGDSSTIFVASGRAVRGGSNTCCGGADALTPGAPHFGVWRSQDTGKTWELVHQGAEVLCTASHPDVVSTNQTACSPRGARRIKFDPVDPNTIYASFYARGIWRSKANGNPGTWEQIMAPIADSAAFTTERPMFDVVQLPNGETRMYVGVGGANVPARFRRNDNVRTAPAATVAASWQEMSNPVPDTPGYSSYAFCDPQCWYDQYVYAPANPENAPLSGATHDTVYIGGANQYGENDHVTGRSNGRAVLLSLNGGEFFHDMTEDASHPTHPGALHPDHHAIVVNPKNFRQFFDLGDGGVNRSNGVFVDNSAQCSAPPKLYVTPRKEFCEMLLRQVPERLNAINLSYRSLHIYDLEYDRRNPERLAFGTQDNGSWETMGSKETWLNVNVADGGHNSFDAPTGDPEFALTGWQGGLLEVRYQPMSQFDVNWISDTLTTPPYSTELVPFIANAITDPVTPGTLWTGREHVFRSDNWGRNPVFGAGEAGKAAHRTNCNVWEGTFVVFPCDDWKPLGDPGPDGRLTSPTRGDRAGGFVAFLERAPSDVDTLWAATSTGRIFVSKNAKTALPPAVVFDRIDDDVTAANDPPRYPTDIFIDPKDPNHAWITYSGYNAKTPAFPGHVFEVRYVPNASTFVVLDGHKINGYGDIPAQSIVVTDQALYVANDYNVVMKERSSDVWKHTPAGLPNMLVTDLVWVPEKDVLYAGTHGQG